MKYIYIYQMKDIANERIKDERRGQSRLPGCHVDCWAAHVSTALKVSQTINIRTHSRIHSKKNSTNNLVILIMMIRVQSE